MPITLLPQRETRSAILTAVVVAFLAAAAFPAQAQSKIWVKFLGADLGAIASGRAWTFVAVLIVVAVLWAILRTVRGNK